jgi:hypothetical protein
MRLLSSRKFVRNPPGSIAVTWMPSGASSCPRLSLRPSTANFAEQ